MGSFLLKLALGGFGWLKQAITALLDLIRRYPLAAALIASLCFSAWSWNGWSDEKAGRKQDAKEYKDELAKRDQASAEALAQQIALNEATKAKYEAAAEKADHDYRIALADADRRTDDFIARNRVRWQEGDRTRAPVGPAESEIAPRSDGPGSQSDMVAVSAEDIRICTENTVRLQAVREWGLSLQAAGVAE